MTLETLKNNIENKVAVREPLFLNYTDNTFIADQYIKELSIINKLPIQYLDDLSSLSSSVNSIFFNPVDTSDSLRIYKCEELTDFTEELYKQKDLVVVYKKSNKDISKKIVIPKLENWQIKDYAYSLCEGVDTKLIDKLLEICSYNIYRVDNEVTKISIFDTVQRNHLFQMMVSDGAFRDLTDKNVFNLTNSIMKRDIKGFLESYTHIENMDVSEMGLLTILYNNFKNMINVQLSRNPIAESCGLTQNQFYAIRYNVGRYTNSQLINIFKIITQTDVDIKTGKLSAGTVIDYLLFKIFTA